MPYTYILECADGSFSVGSTWNLEDRLAQHEAGTVPGHPARHRPIRLRWCLELERLDEAHALERRIHGWRRERKIALIEKRLHDLPRLSKARTVE